MPRHHQSISPNRLLSVEIPTGLDAAIASSSRLDDELPSDKMATAAAEADIKLGERTAFIPMTCQEVQILERLEFGLQQAACLWRDQPEQQEHEKLLGSALHHWQSVQEPGMDTSWVWEVGRWNTQFSLPFALELRRLDPCAMAEADQLLASATCQRNRLIEAAKRQSAPTLAASAASAQAKKKTSHNVELDDSAEEEPCLCQIRWGLAPDTEAAKRRQVEKLLDEDQQLPARRATQKHRGGPPNRQQSQQQPQAPQPQQRSPQSLANAAQKPQQACQQRRPIVKTSHLREQYAAALTLDDPGYASQGSSPPGFHHQQQPQHRLLHYQQQQQQQHQLHSAAGRQAGSHIADLLSSACYGGRDWVD